LTAAAAGGSFVVVFGVGGGDCVDERKMARRPFLMSKINRYFRIYS
jgi:hypothetical protein